MAIYHLEGKIISRSQGRSIVAASAYRAAEKITDERTGITHNFLNKQSDLLHQEILLPKNAPTWMSNRAELWNYVEQVEKRKDAQLAREFNISLPRELTHEQNIKLAHEFVQTAFVERGMVADMCIHRGHKGGAEQPHIHVMLSLREVNEGGFGKKVRAWNGRALIQHWREAWSQTCNRHLALHGHDVQIDHRTLEAQGINLEPQTKIGAKSVQSRFIRFTEHQRIANANGERLLADPQIALSALTRHQSTFSHHDLACFVNRHTADFEQFQRVLTAIQNHPQTIKLNSNNQPQQRYTTREMVDIETKMITQAVEQATQSTYPISNKHLPKITKEFTLTTEQTDALTHITSSNNLACLIGYAGTGKSHLLGAARKLWEHAGYRVQAMALSGIAAENLASSSGVASYTVANRLYRWDHANEQLTNYDVVIVDEAGMIGSRQMARVIDYAKQANAKIVLIGDTEQLQAIDAGAAFRGIIERVGYMEITTIRRQQTAWQQEATKALASARTAEAFAAYEKHDNVHNFRTKHEALHTMVERWQEIRSHLPDKSQMMLAYTRDEVKQLNTLARSQRRELGDLGMDCRCKTSQGIREFAKGDRIYFLRNEYQTLNIKNGTLGTIEKIKGDNLKVRIDGRENEAQTVEFNLNDYNAIDYGYAATIHKAQGITVDRTHILLSPYYDRHVSYVAMSRHREGLDIYYDQEQFPEREKLISTLNRERAKDITLDYTEAHDQTNTIQASHTTSTLKTHEQNKSQEKSNLLKHYLSINYSDELKELQQRYGKSITTYLYDGDQGHYRGNVQLGYQTYGLLEQHNKLKLIPEHNLSESHQDHIVTLRQRSNEQGRVHYEIAHIHERDQNRDIER